MEALDDSIRHLLSLEAPLNAWAAHSAQAAAALVSAAGRYCLDLMLASLLAAGLPVTLPHHMGLADAKLACQESALEPLSQVSRLRREAFGQKYDMLILWQQW